MKSVLLVRHAKSDWSVDADDFDRPLNERGKRDAPMMAVRLAKRKIPIDAFVSSTAKRALRTAKIFAENIGMKKGDILLKGELYLAPPGTFYDVLEKLDDRINTVALFSHNNGITEFANSLGIARIDNMPTCSIFAFTIDSDTWKDFRKSDKAFLFFDYPKKAE
ncbi:MAG TPA: histidine phosphatase family protein [Chitinophagaceae bacterium]|nr:histidine phosphatase family protein [Chitinophagaceae bacterium]